MSAIFNMLFNFLCGAVIGVQGTLAFLAYACGYDWEHHVLLAAFALVLVLANGLRTPQP